MYVLVLDLQRSIRIAARAVYSFQARWSSSDWSSVQAIGASPAPDDPASWWQPGPASSRPVAGRVPCLAGWLRWLAGWLLAGLLAQPLWLAG